MLTIYGLDIPFAVRDLQGFRTWVETLGEDAPRVHFSRGRIHVEMSPQGFETHAPVVDAINSRLRELARAKDLGRYELDHARAQWSVH